MAEEAAVTTLATPPKMQKIETVETLHRTYEVEAPDRETAIRRLRLHWSDPDSLRPEIVTQLDVETVTSRQVSGSKKT